LKYFITLLLCTYWLSASAETIRGLVHNGTSRKPTAGDEVILKRIGNGMEDAGKTRTNRKGEFSFTVPNGLQGPFVVWVKHQEVIYTQIVGPGRGPIAVQIFDGSLTVNDIRLAEYVMVLQTSSGGDQLKVDELYTLDNRSSPPLTKNGEQTFDVFLADNVRLPDASAQTSGSMPLKTVLVADRAEKNRYHFNYPVRPGQTQFHLAYSIPYSGKLAIAPKLSLPAAHMFVVTPASIHFAAQDASTYAPTNNPRMKGASIYQAENIGSERTLGFQVEGTGALSMEQPGVETTAQVQADSNVPGGGLGVPNERPDPLHDSQWMFLCLLALFLGAGSIFIYMSKRRPKAHLSPRRGGTDSHAVLIETLKEELFKLESDRLQRTISSGEYDDQKAALDKVLQRSALRQKI
jgi:hypothetical protein